MASAAPIEENFPSAMDVAVVKGLAYLARQQQADGSFTGFDEPGPRLAPAAGAILAFLSAGQTPMAGRHALVVRNAMDFVIRQLPDDGEFGRADGSGLQGQAIITIALAEAHGLESDADQRSDVHKALGKSLAVILATQDVHGGGWHGEKNNSEKNNEADLNATFWMVLSLRALRDAGLDVPAPAMRQAASFARACAKRDAHGFANPGSGPTPLSNAAGIAVVLMADRGDDDLKEAAKFLREKRVNEDVTDYHAALYTANLAAMLAGDPTWTAQWRPTRDGLMAKQTEDGSWFPPRPPPVGLGTVGATSMAIMTLATPYHLLPMDGARK